MKRVLDMTTRLPLEEFVANENLYTCPISVLRKMVKNRNAIINQNLLLEKSDLEQAIQERRKYGVTCSICFEDFKPGDPLRVLPACRHEFHVECLDKWAYTIGQRPPWQAAELACPNCKLVIS